MAENNADEVQTPPPKAAVSQERVCSVKTLGFTALGFVLGAAIACAIVIPVMKAEMDEECAVASSDAVESTRLSGTNVCAGKKPTSADFDNINCTVSGVVAALEQAGANVTEGYVGNFNTSATPIITTYREAGLCPVNVHWHLGAEHLSKGEYDEAGTGPEDSVFADDEDEGYDRRLAVTEHRLGFRCHHYDSSDSKFTKAYDWKYCESMMVGETYEVHWPHSAAGACGTPNQYQSPFYDGVFCVDGVITSTSQQIGVQAQIFTVVNDEDYYYPDLMRGMIIEGDYGLNITKYTGSTTGTSRSNTICSKYTPITWQVDRKCHLISASTFDKMCADMLAQRDDMSTDCHPHGSRELVDDSLAANNHDHD